MKDYIITDYGVKKDCDSFQTKEIQAVLDLCRENGGKVIIPEGTYKVSSLRIWSDTTLYLMAGARLLGSEACDDYEVFCPPEGMKFYTDSEAFTYIRPNNAERPVTYRHAMITAYGEENISIIGENDAVIDGMDCFDPSGEEGFRGPHGIFLSSCRNVTLKGYTIQNSGNFMHQLDNCENVDMNNVTALAGHDGIHLHCCRNMKITDCVFRTGDDCIAGANVSDITVSGCELNTSCNTFRIGGKNILIENCKAEGPGYYPHRVTVAKNKDSKFERTDGRHNTLVFVEYFASENFINTEPAHNIIIRNCTVNNVDRILHYVHGNRRLLHTGMPLEDITFENVDFCNLNDSSEVVGDIASPVKIILKNVNASFKNDAQLPLFNAEYSQIEEL